MTSATAAILIIGDEILSGRTRDANMHFLAGQLTAKGIQLAEVRVISDQKSEIITAVQSLAAKYDQVFTSGGIGPTHDDITAEAVAAAFDTPISVREDARAILAAHYAKSEKVLNEARLRMARIPDDARLIDNPISGAPGFSLENVHVMAGVPKIFQAMVASVLPTLTGGAAVLSESLRVERPEGDIAGPLGQLAAQFPDLSFGSYPFNDNGLMGAHVVTRGTDADMLAEAIDALMALFPKAR